MEGFLDRLAADLYGRYGDGVSECSLVLPSQRARRFLLDALARRAARPLWQPRWLTVDDLMCEISGLGRGDRLRLITELYRIYREYHNEPFDRFYFWGDMLLSDFDSIDKYRVDASMLFRNISDIKELEADISYLTPAQLKIVEAFWKTLAEDPSAADGKLSAEKRRFLEIWRTLGTVYNRFRERLHALGFAYTGMIHRAAADRLEAGDFTFETPRRYIIAGFNALSECEKRLFRYLQNACDATFYWDYDDYYVRSEVQEAGLFLRENLRAFPPAADLGHEAMRGGKNMEVISTVSNAVQCKEVSRLLLKIKETQGVVDRRTAIVLTDENLLVPLLHALPEDIGPVNVTMGYPLKQTLAYTFVERLIELQNHRRRSHGEEAFYHADVRGLLAHPYIAQHNPQITRELQAAILSDRRISVEASLLQGDELLAQVFRPVDGWQQLSRYLSEVLTAIARASADASDTLDAPDAHLRIEFLALIVEELSKLHRSLEECGPEIGNTAIYTSLLRRHLQTLRIPYEGEPLVGVQIMGILETRNLDFRNVIILSMNDDNFPGNLDSSASFIPFALRDAYGLPTPRHHEGVYAYYFYRLIQRARNVWMLYCSHADDKSTGEPSRYIRQLEYESGFRLKRSEVGVDVNRAENEMITIAKEGIVLQQLQRFLTASHPLSPTALARYIACPLRFYFSSVARLRTSDELTDEVDNPMFGNILHDAARRLYAPLTGLLHPAPKLDALCRGKAIEEAVNQSVVEVCLRDVKARPEDFSGGILLVRDIAVRYLRGGVIPYDARHDGFKVEGTEHRVECNFEFAEGRTVVFGGIADRIDRMDDGSLRIVDYKTGSPHLDYNGVGDLFGGERCHLLGNIFQTLLYCMILHRSRGLDARPALYYVRSMRSETYDPAPVNRGDGVPADASYTLLAERFESSLRALLVELFDPAEPFRQTTNEKACLYCDYREICRR